MNIYIILKLLSDPSRLKILYTLHHGTFCVSEIQQITELSQANVSKHLKKLNNNKILNKKENRQMSYFFLDKDYLETCKIFQPIIDTYELTEDAQKIKSQIKKITKERK